MSLVSKPTELTATIRQKNKNKQRSSELTDAFLMHFDELHSKDYFPIKSVEKIMLLQQQYMVENMGKRPTYPTNMPRFSPSSADKCDRELFYKAVKAEQDEQTMYPFQRRWTRNSTAVHEAVQRNLLEAEVLLDKPKFLVERMEDTGLPAWEQNIAQWKVFEHHGAQFVLYGMMDGVLLYEDGSRIGFEFKTKSNSVAQIKSIKEPQESHVAQCVAYSLLFGIDEYLVTYESVAKDKWSTKEEARPDIKAFYVKVTDKMRTDLLDKFARITFNLEDGEVSAPNYSKCLFCPFKSKCEGE